MGSIKDQGKGKVYQFKKNMKSNHSEYYLLFLFGFPPPTSPLQALLIPPAKTKEPFFSSLYQFLLELLLSKSNPHKVQTASFCHRLFVEL